MKLAIDKMDGHGLSNKVTAEEDKGDAVLAIHFTIGVISSVEH